MKKNIYIFIVLAFECFALVSCEDSISSFQENITTKQVYNFEVKAKDWIANTDKTGHNLFYSYNFKLIDLNPDITLQNCAVLAYIILGNYEQPLPMVRHFEDADGNLWTRTVDFDFSLKDINFYVTNSDFFAEIPEKMIFRVVFLW
jgi:hypothetical protein